VDTVKQHNKTHFGLDNNVYRCFVPDIPD